MINRIFLLVLFVFLFSFPFVTSTVKDAALEAGYHEVLYVNTIERASPGATPIVVRNSLRVQGATGGVVFGTVLDSSSLTSFNQPLRIDAPPGQHILLRTNNNQIRLGIHQDGRVRIVRSLGVGFSSGWPQYALHVNGTARIEGNTRVVGQLHPDTLCLNNVCHNEWPSASEESEGSKWTEAEGNIYRNEGRVGVQNIFEFLGTGNQGIHFDKDKTGSSLYIQRDLSASETALAITSQGNSFRLGVNTASPQQTLDVDGNAIIRGDVRVEGNVMLLQEPTENSHAVTKEYVDRRVCPPKALPVSRTTDSSLWIPGAYSSALLHSSCTTGIDDSGRHFIQLDNLRIIDSGGQHYYLRISGTNDICNFYGFSLDGQAVSHNHQPFISLAWLDSAGIYRVFEPGNSIRDLRCILNL